jgi:cystathionine gamma-lyase
LKITDTRSFATRCIHGGQSPESVTGAVMPPIFQTSTYAQESPGKHKGYEYSRTHNPTRQALERNLAALENGQFAHAFASGCAAATALLMALKSGDEILALDDLYGGTRRLFTQVFKNFNLNFSFGDFSTLDNFDRLFKPTSRMVWLESPSNPLLKLCDIRAIAERCHAAGATLVVDNTFASPALQNPLDLGADIVLHSTTKYIGGHSDVIGGALITNNAEWSEKLAFLSNSLGNIPGPWDAFLTLRGLKTLDIRMKAHSENALFIAESLKMHKKISHVYYPGLKEHPQHALAQKQMRGFSGMLSFVVTGGEEEARRICEKTRIFTCAESLGGVESLIEHPSSMTHASIPKETRAAIGIDDGLVRLSVGIENKMELLEDVLKAIESR